MSKLSKENAFLNAFPFKLNVRIELDRHVTNKKEMIYWIYDIYFVLFIVISMNRQQF